MRIIVIGGGFFGLYIATHCAERGHEVLLFEREARLMSRASYANQARVHNGYHYPRSILTALRSRISFPRFADEFRDCIDDTFEQYYLIGRPLGKVTAQQYRMFCNRIGAVCETASDRITQLTNSSMIEACYLTTEYAFDAEKLRELILARINASTVRYALGRSVEKVWQGSKGLCARVRVTATGEEEDYQADQIFNCTYTRINSINANSGLELIRLKHEITEMCMVRVPEVLAKIGLTVMCGPFFSIMPFPPRQLHSFSHVRYTPHFEWKDHPDEHYRDGHQILRQAHVESAWRHMVLDAARYIPILKECQRCDSIWEVKTVLERSESNDSRPILFIPNHGLAGFHCIMGGKIDNVYDAIGIIEGLDLLSGR